MKQKCCVAQRCSLHGLLGHAHIPQVSAAAGRSYLQVDAVVYSAGRKAMGSSVQFPMHTQCGWHSQQEMPCCQPGRPSGLTVACSLALCASGRAARAARHVRITLQTLTGSCPLHLKVLYYNPHSQACVPPALQMVCSSSRPGSCGLATPAQHKQVCYLLAVLGITVPALTVDHQEACQQRHAHSASPSMMLARL